MRTEKKELNIQIGKRVQIARENSGYTQEAFAEALDVGVEHYRKIELGMHGRGIRSVRKVAEQYGGNLLLEDEGDTFKASLLLTDVACLE